MTTLILPVAGASSRYPGVRPKYMLVHPFGDIMLFRGIRGLDLCKIETVHVTMLKEHVDKYDAYDGIMRASVKLGLFERIKITVLDERTKDQPETVVETIKRNNITGPFFVKDSDNYFEVRLSGDNAVSVFNIETLKAVNAGNKSYATVNNGIITNIVEKRVISPLFCCGGYSFADVSEFLKYYGKSREDYPDNLYLSHVIYRMMLDEIPFVAHEASNYVDWGTLEDWERYREGFGTVFADLDGVIVENSGEYFLPLWGSTGPIAPNVLKLNNLYHSGKFHVIITTSRAESNRAATEKQLDDLGVKYHRILFDLPHARCYLINDYAASNPYPASVAINIERNGKIQGLPECKPVVIKEKPKPVAGLKKRIAVCISGLARTFDQTIDNFRKYVLEISGCEIDIFISTWDKIDSEVSTEAMVRKEMVRDGVISESAFSAYSPRSIEIEREFEWRTGKIHCYENKRTDTFVPSTLFMLYKIWCADLMRRKFEQAHGFEYDMVVRTRFDLKMTERVQFDLGGYDILVPNMATPICDELQMAWLNDTFAIGTSEAMRTYADMYLNIDKLYESGVPFQPEIMLCSWLHWNNLKVGTPNSYPLILRPSGKITRRPENDDS